jgi:hypothetical protein
MNYVEARSWYARGLRILLRGLPLEERFKILEQLEAGVPEEEVLQGYGRQPRKFAPVKAFLEIVEDIRKIRQEAFAEVREDLEDMKEQIQHRGER